MHRRHALPISVLALSLVGVAVAQNVGPTRSAAEEATKERFSKSIIPMQLNGQTLATDLIGATAYTRSGGEVGRVKDLLFDRNGKLAGLVVSVGGIFGFGAKEIAIPYELADVVKASDGTMTGVRIGLSRIQVESAPEFRAASDGGLAAEPPAEAEPAAATASRPM